MDKEKRLIYFDNLGKYLRFGRDKRMSSAHIYMISACVSFLETNKAFRNAGGSSVSITVIKDYKADKLYPDVYTPLFDIECETGLKGSYDDLKERILKNKKTVIVVVPNTEVLGRYKRNCSVRKTHLFFCTLEGFPLTVKSAIRPFQNRLKSSKSK